MTEDDIVEAIRKQPLEDQPIVLMMLMEKYGLRRYSNHDYKKAYAVRKKMRKRNLKQSRSNGNME